MEKQNVVYPYNGVLSTMKRNEVLIHKIHRDEVKNIILNERS